MMMTGDGANLGMRPDEALRAVLGGGDDVIQRSTAELAAEIEATTSDPHTYDGTALYCAHLILDWLAEDPVRATTPPENVYRKDDSGSTIWPPEIVQHGWYDRMTTESGIDMSGLDLTGFMWGWAVNAARTVLELPSVPNPAILDL